MDDRYDFEVPSFERCVKAVKFGNKYIKSVGEDGLFFFYCKSVIDK